MDPAASLCWPAGFADDYALLIAGLLDLYEAGGGLQWLQWAVELQDTLDTTFWDPTGGLGQDTESLRWIGLVRVHFTYRGSASMLGPCTLDPDARSKEVWYPAVMLDWP